MNLDRKPGAYFQWRSEHGQCVPTIYFVMAPINMSPEEKCEKMWIHLLFSPHIKNPKPRVFFQHMNQNRNGDLKYLTSLVKVQDCVL